MKDKIVIAIYIRVSTQEQAKEGYSIDEQKERLEKYAEAHDWIIKNIYSDPGFSGSSLDRPSIQRLIEDVKAGQINKVVVYKLDRLSRSQKDTLYLIEDIFLANNVDFVSMTENFDTGTPLGRAMIGILSVFAQLEREQIKERMGMGREGRAKSGLFHGSTKIPIGYRYVDGVLTVDPYEARIIRRVFQEFAEGRSVYSITADLKNEGVSSSYGLFSRSTVQYMLKNITYLGKIKHNDQIFEGQHEPIIEQEIFDRCQARFEKARLADAGYNFTHKTELISGLCYCGTCGQKMRVNSGAKRKDGTRLRYISCPGKTHTGCTCKATRIELVQDYILDQIKRLSLDPDYFDQIRRGKTSNDQAEEIRVLEAKIKENQGKISRLMDLYALDGIDFVEVSRKIEKFTVEVNSLKKDINRLRETEPGKTDEEIKRMAYSLETYLNEKDREKIRAVISALIEKIVIGPDVVSVHWSF